MAILFGFLYEQTRDAFLPLLLAIGFVVTRLPLYLRDVFAKKTALLLGLSFFTLEYLGTLLAVLAGAAFSFWIR